MTVPSMNVDLLSAHPFDRIVIDMTNLITNKKLFRWYHGAEFLRPPKSSDWLECDTSNSIGLLGLKSNIFRIVETPETNLSIVTSDCQDTLTAFR